MANMKLTERATDRLPAPHPSGKQTIYWDAELKGFGVLVSGKTCSKIYIVQRKLPDGRTRRVTIDATNVLSLDRARQEAEAKLHDIHIGNDPNVARAGANWTLRQALAGYLAARKDLR